MKTVCEEKQKVKMAFWVVDFTEHDEKNLHSEEWWKGTGRGGSNVFEV